MAKKKERCEHGYAPVYMTGCASCVVLAMDAFDVCRANGIGSGGELFLLLRRLCDSDGEKLKAMIVEARAEIALARKAEGGKEQGE